MLHFFDVIYSYIFTSSLSFSLPFFHAFASYLERRRVRQRKREREREREPILPFQWCNVMLCILNYWLHQNIKKRVSEVEGEAKWMWGSERVEKRNCNCTFCIFIFVLLNKSRFPYHFCSIQLEKIVSNLIWECCSYSPVFIRLHAR